MQGNSTAYAKQFGNAMSLLAQALPSSANPCLFDYPFNELLVNGNNINIFPIKQFLSLIDLGCIDEEAQNGLANVAAR